MAGTFDDENKAIFGAVVWIVVSLLLVVLFVARGYEGVAWAFVLLAAGGAWLLWALGNKKKTVARHMAYQERLAEREARTRLERERARREEEERERAEAERRRERERVLDELVDGTHDGEIEKKPQPPAVFTCRGCGAVNRTAEDGTMVCEYCGNPHG